MDDHVEGRRHLAADRHAEGDDLGVHVLAELPPAEEDHVLAHDQPVHVGEGETEEIRLFELGEHNTCFLNRF